jgi:hypothetical protein
MGRIDEVFVSTNFRGITDIQVDNAGGFVVTEGNQTPQRRTAKFDQAGYVIFEWLGCRHYGVLACPKSI